MKTTRRYRKAYNKGKAYGYAEGYRQGFHDGNPFNKIVEAASDLAKVISDKMSDPEFLETLKKAGVSLKKAGVSYSNQDSITRSDTYEKAKPEVTASVKVGNQTVEEITVCGDAIKNISYPCS